MTVANVRFRGMRLVLALLLLVPGAHSQEINWFSMESGGGHATGGEVHLLGVIGQVDTQVLSAGNLTLSGGYLPITTSSDVIFKDTFE